MKRLNLLLILMLVLAVYTTAFAGNVKIEQPEIIVPDAIREKLEKKLLEVTGGNEYLVVVTPNDPTAGNYKGEMFIGSKEPAEVIVEQGGRVVDIITITRPYDIKVFQFTQNQEVRGRTEEPEQLAFRVHSDKDIMVYVSMAASTTAEGYMALPVSALGTRYIHCSSPNNNESADLYHTGFIVGAPYDNTKVDIKIQGQGISSASACVTEGSSTKIGGKIRVNLNAWEAVNIWSKTGAPRGECDFSGSIITSDKPVALFSYNERTDWPIGVGNRDNLCEQLLPVDKWGKTHISLQLLAPGRKTGAPLAGEKMDKDLASGDYFRVMASEPETYLDVTWWHPFTGEHLGEAKKIKLENEGNYWHYNPNLSRVRASGVWGIRGMALFVSNKPVQVLQYGYSTGWGFSGDADPLMVIVPPVEQYGYETVFQTSSYDEMNVHRFNLVVEGNPNNYDDNEKKLSSVEVFTGGSSEGWKIASKDDKFYQNRIPTTNYYFALLGADKATSYSVRGQTKLSGIIYGYGSVISYGWPASMSLVETSAKDTLAPEISHTLGCSGAQQQQPDRIGQQGRIKFISVYADTTSYPPIDEFTDPQEDLGLKVSPRLLLADNLEITRFFYDKVAPNMTSKSPTTDWAAPNPVHAGKVEISISDIYEDAMGFLEYRDRAGNVSVDTLIYVADRINLFDESNLEIDMIDFGSKTLGNSYSIRVKIRNTTTTDMPKTIRIDSLFLNGKNGTIFTLTKGGTGFPIIINPSEEHEIELTYTPTSGGNVTDLLTIYTECLKFQTAITAGAGIAKIRVSDFNFGQVFVGNLVYTNGTTTASLQIQNVGTEDLVVTGWSFDPTQTVDGPFFFDPLPVTDEPRVDNPIVIPPKVTKNIRRFGFKPVQRIPYEAKIYFESNAADIILDPDRKEWGQLKGEGIQAGPQITNKNWGEKRVLTVNDGYVELTNGGNTPIKIRDIDSKATDNWQRTSDGALTSPDGSYKVLNVDSFSDIVVYPTDGADEPKVVQIPVRFIPQSERPNEGSCPTSVEFYVNFDKSSGVPDYTIMSTLEGIGILPKILEAGDTFPKTLVNTTCTKLGSFVVRNTSKTSKLYIKSIKFDADPKYQTQDFTISPALNSQDGAYIAIEDSIEFQVTFRPLSTAPPQRIARILVESDAATGPDENPIVLTDAFLVAQAFDEGLTCGPINFGTVTRCAEEILEIIIVNESTTNEAIIDSVVIDPTYKGVFELYPDADFYKNKSIPANGTLKVQVKLTASEYFAGNAPAQGPITANIQFYNDVMDLATTIKAEPLIIPVDLSMKRFENQTPGRELEFPIDIKMDNSNSFFTYSNANITEFTIVLSFDAKTLRFTGTEGPWTYNINADYSAGTATITGKGNPLTSDGKLVGLKLQPLLSSNNDFEVTFTSISFGGRDNCISTTNNPGSVKFTVCAEDLRGIVVGGKEFGLEPIAPNPHIGKELTINYSLGFDVDVNISIFNAAGELVKTVVDGGMRGGSYTATTNVAELGSGTYMIIMKSGPYETQQQLIIAK